MLYTDLFSPTEIKVLRALGSRRMTVTELAKKYFAKATRHVFDPNAVIYMAVRRINKKCEFHKLDWFIDAEGLGRGGKTVWVKKR